MNSLQFKKDYMKWIKLEYEPDETVGLLEPEWNDFDKLTPATKILHNTYRRTQPWKAGLPVDFTVRVKPKKASRSRQHRQGGEAAGEGEEARLLPARIRIRSRSSCSSRCCGECLEKGIIDVDLVKREMAANHVRHDALELVQRRAA